MLQLPYYLWYQAEILLSLGKDPELFVVRHLCIQDNAFGSQTPIYDWKLDCQMAFFWPFDPETQIFGIKPQNTCTSQLQSNLIKPLPQNLETRGCSLAGFSQKLLMILR